MFITRSLFSITCLIVIVGGLAPVQFGLADDAEVNGRDWHVHYFNERRPLELDVERVAVLDTAGRDPEALRGDLEPHGLAEQDVTNWHVNWRIVTVPEDMRGADDTPRLAEELADAGAGEFVSPVFVDSFGKPTILQGDVLVRFESHIDDVLAEVWLLAIGPGEIVDRDWGGMERAYRIRPETRSGADVLDIANTLAQLPGVLFAEPNMIITAQHHSTPNDPYFLDQWALNNTGQDVGLPCDLPDYDLVGDPGIDSGALASWEVTTGDPDIITVVLDNGVQQDHPDLNQIPGADFTGEEGGDGGPMNECDNHGTPVAGVISAIKNNNMGIAGLAPGTRIASARVFVSQVPCTGFGSIDNASFVEAVEWAEQIGAKVTNTSLGFGTPSSAIEAVFDETRDAGIIHFASAGNSQQSEIGFPSSVESVNSVSAMDMRGDLVSTDNWWWGSNYGEGLVFSAPGIATISTDRTGSDGSTDGDVTCFGGTSAASPYAAAVAALILSVDPDLTPEEIDQVIMPQGAIDLGEPGYNTKFGWGLVHAANSFDFIDTIYYVPEDFPTIQAAIDGTVDGDTIFVAPGTYNETIDFQGKAVSLRSLGAMSETIIDGGGQGSVITAMSGEGPDTVLSGFTITGGTGTSVDGTVRGGGAYLEGSSITITYCHFEDNSAVQGGGVYLKGSSTSIAHCHFEGHTADEGGAIYTDSSSMPSVSGSFFCDNDPDNIAGPWENAGLNVLLDACDDVTVLHVPENMDTIGAAIELAENGTEIIVAPGTYNELIDFQGKSIHLRSSHGPGSTVIDGSGLGGTVVNMVSGEGADTILEGFTITGGTGTNSSDAWAIVGGGIYIVDGDPFITNCHFIDNNAERGAGMYNLNSNPTVSHCIFEENSGSHGAGIYNINSSPDVSHTFFIQNSASLGGGMYNTSNSHPNVTDCSFLENSAVSPGSWNGRGGGMYNNTETSPTVIRTSFIGNWAWGDSPSGGVGQGGAMYNFGSAPLVQECTFESNYAENECCTPRGGAIRSGGGLGSPALPVEVGNSSFCNNDPNDIEGDWDDLGGNSFTSVCPPPQPPNPVIAGPSCNEVQIEIPDGAEPDTGVTWYWQGTSCGTSTAHGSDSTFTVTEPGTYHLRAVENGEWSVACSSVEVTSITPCPDIVNVPEDFPTIQEAINFIADGVEVVVQPGVYNESIDLQGKAVHLRSSAGAQSTIIDASGLDTSAVIAVNNETPDTIIQGFTITGGTGSYANGDYLGGGMYIALSSPTILEVVFEENSADFGGGMFVVNGSAPYIELTTFKNNEANAGGGMYIFLECNPTIIDSEFSENSAEFGGAMFNAIGGNPTIDGVLFSMNTADDEGGAIVNADSTPTITNCTFEANIAGINGGAMLTAGNYAPPPVSNTVFCENEPNHIFGNWSDEGGNELSDFCASTVHVPEDFASIQQAINAVEEGMEIVVAPGVYEEGINFSGKAIHLRSSDGPGDTIIQRPSGQPGSVVVTMSNEGSDTILEGFTITGGTGSFIDHGITAGGGMINSGTSPTVIDCIFEGNEAWWGAGMYNIKGSNPMVIDTVFEDNLAISSGGGIANLQGSSPWIENCDFIKNVAEDGGGGVYNDADSNPTITDCLFYGNGAGEGAAVQNRNSHPELIGCTLEFNEAGNGGGILNTEFSSSIIVNSVIHYNTALNEGGGILNVGTSFAQLSDTLLCNNKPDNIVGSWTDLGNNDVYVLCPGTSPSSPPDPVIVSESCEEVVIGWPSGTEPISGAEWYWQGTSCDQSTALGNSPTLNVQQSGTYYIRAKNANSDDWSSQCGSITVTIEECPAVIHVPNDQPTITAAISAAGDGTEIIVAPGTYNETIDTDGKTVHLRSSDGPDETIIDVAGSGTSAITIVNGEDAIIEGFTISGGEGTLDHGDTLGGGLFIEYSSPTIINCIFTNNTAEFGGALFSGGGNPVIEQCTFDNNSGMAGGAILVTQGDLTVTDCLFVNNNAQSGGAITGLFHGNTEITNSHFENNEANAAAAIANTGFSQSMIAGSSFIDNTATDLAGAIGAAGESFTFISDCLFERNTAGDLGGAIFSEPDSPSEIADTTFCENEPDTIEGPWDDLGGNEFLDLCADEPDTCPADLTGPEGAPDGVVDVFDLLMVISAWGECSNPEDCTADLTGPNDQPDGVVDVFDLLKVISEWGPCS